MLRTLSLALLAVGCGGGPTLNTTPLVFGELCDDATFAPVSVDELPAETQQQLDDLFAAEGSADAEVVWSDDLEDVLTFTLEVQDDTLVRREDPGNDYCPEAVFTTVTYTVTTSSGRLDLTAKRSVDLENAFRDGELQLNHTLEPDEAEPIRDDLDLDDWQDIWLNVGAKAERLTNVEVAYSTSTTSTLCRRAAVLASASGTLDANCD